MIQRVTYFLILAGFAGLACAGGADTIVSQPQPASHIMYCPPIKELKKDLDSRTWSAAPGWKSYDISFVDKVTSFAGAQWRGTNVGQIFCVYRGESPTSFPILLAYRTLTYAPHGGKWSANLGGYHNCETPHQEECPFAIRVQPEATDLYEQAEKLKHSAPPSSRPGF